MKLFEVFDVKLWNYAVVDMYGGMMSFTASDTKEECIRKFNESYKNETVESLHCAIIRIVPMLVSGDKLHQFNQPKHFEFLKKGTTE